MQKMQHFLYIPCALIIITARAGLSIHAVPGIFEPQKSYMELFTRDEPTLKLGKASKDENAEEEISNASKGCSSRSLFSSFKPECRNVVRVVADMLMAQRNASLCIALAETLKVYPNLHPMAWYTAVTMATFQHPDLQFLWKPSPIDVVPDLYLNSRAINQAKQNQLLRKGENGDQCVILDERFAEDNGAENRMWYFREDIQVNAQHWFWHLTYPTNSTYRADRRGELFYYFHHHMIARYNTERLANGLPRTQNFRLDPSFVMEEGYNPHLYDPISETNFVPRAPMTPLPPYIQNGRFTLQELMTYNSRLMLSINSKTFVYANYATAPITFDALVDTVERSIWSINPYYYGSLHNSVHSYIAYSSVWTNLNSTVYGVMEELTTSMRDPAFYQWHGYLDSLYFQFKKGLPPYQLLNGDFPLVWNKIQIQRLDMLPSKTLKTFWSLKNLTLTRRLNFGGKDRSEFLICVKHLDHDSFDYELVVNSDGSSPMPATVRIFMAPRFTENGKRFPLDEQMMWFFAMDSYKTTLQTGKNTLSRSSSNSSLTVPWERNLAALGFNVSRKGVICGTGWPEHLLLPKGTPSGQVFDLVVMVTDGKEDIVEDEDVVTPEANCISAPILAGVYRKLYPDRKPMGYPFDRVPFKPSATLEEYVGMIPNMATTQITIVHEDKIRI